LSVQSSTACPEFVEGFKVQGQILGQFKPLQPLILDLVVAVMSC
jgi:hypothetical protein